MWNLWNTAFKNTLGHADSLVREQLREVRNREADYERRLTAADPIHPELFDRLFTTGRASTSSSGRGACCG